MSISGRDRKLLGLWAVVMIAGGIYYFSGSGDSTPGVAASVDSIPLAERRVARMRQLASMVPGKKHLVEQARADLASREKGMLAADTAPQAQAMLLQLMQKLAKAENIELKTKELGQARPLGDAYGVVTVSIGFESTIDATLNLLARITQQPELIATDQVRISAANAKQKTVQVRLTVSAAVPRKLVPEKKGLAAF
ncbi:MAG: hypothetical protein IT160_01550 [Bryobacterales bacterium]|nr:hypothetical protein [Bryobacterales bacterium]